MDEAGERPSTADLAEERPSRETREEELRDDEETREVASPASEAEAPAPAEEAPSAVAAEPDGRLLVEGDAEAFRARWTDIQNGFVDAPRGAVEQADALVAELMQHLARTFADARSDLERQWDRGDEVSTDDLRVAFQRYRMFFERLLVA